MALQRLLFGVVLALLAATLMTPLSSELAAEESKAEKKKAFKKLLKEAKKLETKEPAKTEPVKAEPVPVVTKSVGKPSDPKVIAQRIDQEINRKLADAKITSSPTCSDADFIRRASLDIAGVIPTAEQVKTFLDSKDANKRAKLIDDLLASPRYGQHLADIWVAQMYPMDSDNRFVSKQPLTKYLYETFNANKPWDKMAYEIISASGDADKLGATVYYMANRGVDKITDSVSKLFLGVQIQCAQCHNHPFAEWKQTEYWGLAQFFYKVDVTVPRNNKQTSMTAMVSETDRPNRRLNPLPESAKSVSPKYLGGETPKLDSSKPYRPALAEWITSPKNPYFAKSMVNRTWNQFFGRGLVNPIDDLRDDNEATHPELFEALTREFIDSGFDLKHLIRCICLSDAYQRSSIPTPENKQDTVLYSHQVIKVMTPEQLYDSIATVLGSGLAENGRAALKQGAQRRGPVSPRDRFVAFFMGGENAKPSDYEAGIPQALRLMNNPRMNSTPGLINELSRAGSNSASVIEKLYLMTVSRRPTETESKKMIAYVAKESDPRQAYSDILWALLNSSEFTLNR